MNSRFLLLSFVLFSFLFSYKVEFVEKFSKFIIPNQKVILLTKQIPIEYSPKIYSEKGTILLDYEKADQFIRNSFYLPKGVEVKELKVGVLDKDRFRLEIIDKIKRKYRGCRVEKLIFLNDDIETIYFKPKNVTIKTKVELNCQK